MPLGETLPPEDRPFPDPRTGRGIRQITTADCASEAVYFEQQGFTADERYLVLRSERGGPSNLYRCDLTDGSLTPLLPGEGRHLQTKWTPVFHDGRSVLLNGSQIRTAAGEPAEDSHHLFLLDIETGELSDFATLPDSLPGKVNGSTMTRDGRYLAFGTTEAGSRYPIPTGVSQKEGPRMHIGRYDRQTGEVVHVAQWDGGFSHVLINPTDPDRITFIPNGALCWNMTVPDDQRARTMVARVGSGTVEPLITPLKYRTVTHETWSRDGERMFFFDKTYPDWLPVSVCSVDKDGGDWQCHYMTYRYYLGHGSQSPDGRYFIADCQKWQDSPLLEIDLETGRADILCWPDASQDGGHGAAAHVHPSYSPSGRYITYTSDQLGQPQVFVLEREG
ncbi:MAG: hypothetical protein ACFE0O_04980 [Opitutales bacterium]